MDNNKITITINDKDYRVDAGQTIMQAADKCGYHIPRLCYHPKLSIEGACRVYIVKVEGAKNYIASCCYPIADGMKIHTNTKDIRQARRDIVELLLDNHPADCHTCERDGNCELQKLAYAMGIRHRHFAGERQHYEQDLSSPSVVRDPDKCVLCGRCVRMCQEIQEIHAIDYAHRGFNTVVVPAYNRPFGESVCSHCGQCTNVCPTAAFTEKTVLRSYSKFWMILRWSKWSRSPQPSEQLSVRPLASIWAANMEHETAAALRRLGFDYVFDTQFSADLTIMEEASEFLEWLEGRGALPMITSCCPGWINTLEIFHPDMIEHVSTCKSPMSMMSNIIKTYFAEKNKVDPSRILSMAVMPCTAKKCEAERPEHSIHGHRSTDLVITTRELAWMIKSAGIDFIDIQGEAFDKPLGMSSGGGTIFGVTGGVMEAAIRTAYELYTGETLVDIELEAARGFTGIKDGTLEIGGKDIRVAIAHGLGHIHKLLDLVRHDPQRYHFIEMMACPGGCIGGGGQPYPCVNSIPLDEQCLQMRASALYGIDHKNTIRRSHDNPEVQHLYKAFLGRPLGHKSHELLHTQYSPRGLKGILSGPATA